MQSNTSEKELPITKLHRAYNAKSAVVSLYPTVILMVLALGVSALLAIFSQSQIGFWVGLVSIMFFSILSIVSIRDLIKKTNVVIELAIQNAWDFGTEYNDHDMTKFHHNMEWARNSVPMRRHSNLGQRLPREDHPEGPHRF